MKAFLVIGLLVLAFALVARPNHGASDPAGALPNPTLEDEPISGEPAEPNPGDEEAPPHLGPYETGGPAAEVTYEQLSPEERAVADRGRDAAGWQGIHQTYRLGAQQIATDAAADTAARRLGVRKLEHMGVVP
jgi:hypothetical protein